MHKYDKLKKNKMKKELTKEEWTEIANKAKEISDNFNELSILLSKKLPNGEYLNKLKSANKSFGNLRSHLDEMGNRTFSELTVHFYGSREKD